MITSKVLRGLGIIICILGIVPEISLTHPNSEFGPTFMIIILSLGLIIYGIGHLISIFERQQIK